jgi:predicted exporter
MARRALLLLIWAGVVGGCGWWAFATAPLNSEVSQFISTDDPVARLLDEIGRSRGGRFIYIGIGGGSEADRSQASLDLATTLRASGLFARVSNGSETLTADDIKPLFAMRYLLSPTVAPERFSEESLRAIVAERVRELASPVSVLERRLLPSDPTGEILTLQRLWKAAAQPPLKRHGVWFSKDGARALVVAEAAGSGLDPGDMAPALAAVDDAIAAAVGKTGTEASVGGLGVLVASAQATVRNDAERLAVIGSGLVAAIIAIAFRSPLLVLLSAVPLLSAVMVAGAAVAALFGSIYGLALGMAVTLLGVVDDYPIHVFAHLENGEAPRKTVMQLWPTIRLSAVTTTIGYGLLATTSFAGLTQLAAFSVVGLMTAALVTRYLLPELLPGRWRWRGGVTPGNDAFTAAIVGLRLPRPGLVGAVVLAAAATGVIIAPPRWETDIAAFNPVPAAMVAADRVLRRDLGIPEPGHLIVIRAATADAALAATEQVTGSLDILVRDGVIGGYVAATTFLPSAARQQARQQALPEWSELERRIEAAAAGLPLKPGLFRPFLEGVAAAKESPPVNIDSLRPTLIGPQVEALLFTVNNDWLSLVQLADVADPMRLKAALAPLESENVRAISIRAETNRLLEGFRDQALDRLGLGIILFAGVLWVAVRSLRRLGAVALPVAVGVTLDLLVLAALGERLSLFHLAALLLVMVLGLDYSLFFSAENADPAYHRRSLVAIAVGGASTAALFGILTLSSVTVLNAIGKTVAIGVAFTFIAAVLLARPPETR